MKNLFRGIGLNLNTFLLLPLIVINLIFTQLPLINTLGYESSVINSVILFLILGLFSVRLQRVGSGIPPLELIRKNGLLIITIILIPFIIGLISSFFVAKCPVWDGILFYLIITVPAAFFGIAVGLFSGAFSRKYSYPIFITVYFIMLFSFLMELYLYPQIYFYNSIFGFYPGTIYDEDLSVDHILAAYRIINLAFFILLAASSFYIKGKNNFIKIIVSIGLLTITVLFSYSKPILKFASDTKRLESKLTKAISTESFTIHYPDDFNKDEAEYAAILHEYYLDQIKNTLRSDKHVRINSYIFENRDQKRVLLGAGNADIAKPWLNQIYLNSSDYQATLKHELVHILAGEFGSTPFKGAHNLNPSLIEGFAMAFEDNYDGYPVHFMAKLARSAGYYVPLGKLFEGLNFFTSTSSVSYIQTGSFIKYLSDKYGVYKAKELYGNSDFRTVFGKDISALVAEYEAFINNYSIDFNKYQAQLYFGGSTIFRKFCPRVAASEVKEARKLLNSNQIQEALKLFKKVFAYSKSFQSLTGIIACYSKDKNFIEAEKYLSGELPNFTTSSYYFYLELAYGDILIHCGNWSKARVVYNSLLNQNPQLQYTSEVKLRETILNGGIDSLKNYLSGNATLRYNKLLNINSLELNYYTVPSLLLAAENGNVNLEELLNFLKARMKVTDSTSGNAALQASRTALRHAYYETAQYFAVEALKFKKDENLNHRYVENLKMVNWFKNNAAEMKLTLSKINEF